MRFSIVTLLILFIGINPTMHAYQKKHLEYRKAKKKALQKPTPENATPFEGFFNFKYIESKDQIHLEVRDLDQEFLYVSSLSEGIGSNDIGLDRGQLGERRIVSFQKAGNKLLLIQPNYKYRATTDNPLERKSVTQAFAKSVLFGFPIVKEEKGVYWIDITPFLKQDAHGVAKRLRDRKQGSYKVDPSRSALHMDRTKAFPQNIEMDVLLTFTGEPKGNWIQSVTPSPDAVSVHQHHSFIALPDDGFEKRKFDPRAGVNALRYYDYATPVEEATLQEWIVRHRLEKKNPDATVSEAVAPIIYYLDNGTPEPVRSALLEGGRWWNQAFEAIGYKDAFQVKILPDDADPLDIRYNVIQWVHRSTRGWSYGASVVDPRTGEIIKGHVSLGSLRIRQDYMIALGLTENPFEAGEAIPEILEMALARIRQLSAHEIGHTLGFAHNFAASSKDRASVMDYPHPTLSLVDGKISYSNAYATGIGAWDKVSVAYAYSDFPNGTDTKVALTQIIENSTKAGLPFISDQDARPLGGAHPTAHLWDNGANASEELHRLMAIRKVALQNFGLSHMKDSESYSRLEDRLVPLYLLHRYQVEAVSKCIGGLEYAYAVKGNIDYRVTPLAATEQKLALEAFLNAMTPENLTLPSHLYSLLPPRAFGDRRSRETFKGQTGVAFDHLSLAQTLIKAQFQMLFHPERVNRLVQQSAFNPQQLSFESVIDRVWAHCSSSKPTTVLYERIQQLLCVAMVNQMMELYQSKSVFPQVSASVLDFLQQIIDRAAGPKSSTMDRYLSHQVQNFLKSPSKYQQPAIPKLPDGSPIGSFQCSIITP